MRHGRGPYRLPPCHPSERTKPCHCSYRVAPHQSLSYFTPTLSRAPLHVILLIIGALLSSSSLPGSRTLDAAAPRLAVAQGGEAASLKAAFLVETWSEAYGLGGDSVLPPSAVSLPAGVPAAPHLEDCALVSAEREAWERRGARGEEPAWTRGAPRKAQAAAASGDGAGAFHGCSGQEQGEGVPQPPWIRGPDEANLPLTRVVQRDIWRSQFPPGDCTDRRLLVAHWAKSTSHGVGSQIHYMSALLSVAMRHNRTLVAQPDSFDRARTPSCEAAGHNSQWECFFFPPASSACRHVIQQALMQNLEKIPWAKEDPADVAAGDDPIVIVGYTNPTMLFMEAGAVEFSSLHFPVSPPPPRFLPPCPSPSASGERDVLRCMLQSYHAEEQVVLAGALVAGIGSAIHHAKEQVVHWWRAQAVRFIMRWPSAHLCHVTNQERHRAFAMLAANLVARFLHTQSETLSSLSHSTAPAAAAFAAAASAAPIALNVPANATDWEARRRRAADRLAALAGSSLSFHSDATGSATGGGDNDNGNGSDASWSLGVQEPYMPRPIVSLHVRGTDKFAEMGLTSLDSHLFQINRLRQHGLDLSHVWLNTETQVICFPNDILPVSRSRSKYFSSAFNPFLLLFLPDVLRPPPPSAFSPCTTQANVDRAADHLSWSFFYSSNARQQEAVGGLREYEWAQSVAVSLASVLIAAQCDYLVGSLGSNWSRLMNELRSTNGRLGAGFIADNVEEW
ncbi:unnamed protein product [Closterium sp. NIES-65]|nr:unnamed protein product [Closterium sp. NIES-65]CAI5974788.1 unnamed protein product [Closterium sp. NIES-65]